MAAFTKKGTEVLAALINAEHTRADRETKPGTQAAKARHRSLNLLTEELAVWLGMDQRVFSVNQFKTKAGYRL